MDSENNIINKTTRSSQDRKDDMNNEVSSTSDRNTPNAATVPSENISHRASYDDNCSTTSTDSQNTQKFVQNSSFSPETDRFDQRSASTDATIVQTNISNVDVNDGIQIPIVGYEVMEERARFTIFKLKVVDPKSSHSWLVFRRYTDFVRLYSRVKAERPGAGLPLPGKRWFRDNFEPLFLEERARGLQVFVNALIRRLPSHPRVREFFCLDEPPQMVNYQPEVQAVYGALEDSISSMKTQLKQKDNTILYLQQRIAKLESSIANCEVCAKSSCS